MVKTAACSSSLFKTIPQLILGIVNDFCYTYKLKPVSFNVIYMRIVVPKPSTIQFFYFIKNKRRKKKKKMNRF